MTRAVATLALSVTLVGSPVASLYCDNSTPAAMACCRNKAPECNQPGTSDDCCRTPVEKDVFASEFVIRAYRAGLRVREIPVRVLEKRTPSINLVRRVPNVLKSLAKLTWAIRVKG